jgi:hypothetical protein
LERTIKNSEFFKLVGVYGNVSLMTIWWVLAEIASLAVIILIHPAAFDRPGSGRTA